MNGDRKLRVGIVGSGFGGSVHAPAYAAQGAFEVVALASPTRAADVARARRIPNAFATLEEMLAAVDLDVVSIASPPFDHRAAVLGALERGLHVMCEKPFALNVPDAEELRAAAASAGTVCALAHEFRFTSAHLALKELVDNGHVGALRALEANMLGTSLRESNERPNSWWFERRLGGGVTGALLSHLIDLAGWLAGRASVRATGYERTAIPERYAAGARFTSDVADGAFATIDYGAGLIATVTTDQTRVVESATLAVHGSARTAVASGPNMLEVRTFVVDDDETAELELTPQPYGNLAAAHPNLPAFVALLDAFADAIAGRPAPFLPNFDDGVATQRVLAAVGYTTP
jgi:predicted dehydrogenase